MSKPISPAPEHAQVAETSDIKWFAGLAMQAIIAKQSSVPDKQSEREEVALWAYRMAQAMVATEKRLHVEDA